MEIIQDNWETKTCPQSLDFPLEVYVASGGVLDDGRITICGGSDASGKVRSECYTLTNGVWQPRAEGLNITRLGHRSSVVFNNNTLWMTGGYGNDQYLSSTELIHPDGRVTTGPDLPKARGYHCQMSFGDKILITGNLYIFGQ